MVEEKQLAPGEKVEIAQQQSGRIVWIYARVIVPNAEGGALVQIDHRSNRDDGKQVIVTADQLRTKAAVEQMLTDKNRTEFNRSFRDRDNGEFTRHCQAQIDRLG